MAEQDGSRKPAAIGGHRRRLDLVVFWLKTIGIAACVSLVLAELGILLYLYAMPDSEGAKAFWDKFDSDHPWRMTSPIFAHQLLVVAIVLVAGTVAYFVRCRWQGRYGTFEIAIGVVIAVYAANNSLATPNAWFAIAGAIYVIVRGYDNVYKSIRESKEKYAWNWSFFGKPDEKSH